MIIISIPSLATFECFGFKKAVGFGVVLTGICAMLRGVFGDSYTMVLIVTIGFAIAQPFLLNSPGLVAGKWFPEGERATANSVGLLCSYLGMCVGLLLTPVMLEGGMSIKGMLMVYGIVGAVSAVLFLVFVKEKPADTSVLGGRGRKGGLQGRDIIGHQEEELRAGAADILLHVRYIQHVLHDDRAYTAKSVE